MSITFSRIKDNETEAPHSGILAWKIPWTESPHGTASRTDWSNTARAHAQSLSRVGLCCVKNSGRQAPCPRALQSRILGWVAMPSSRGSSWPRGGTHISYISCPAGGFISEPPGKPERQYYVHANWGIIFNTLFLSNVTVTHKVTHSELYVHMAVETSEWRVNGREFIMLSLSLDG